MKEAFAPLSVAITLDREIDIGRGDVLAKPNNAPNCDQDIDAMICWFSDKPIKARGKYIVRHMTKETQAIVKDIRYKIDINTLRKDEEDLEFRLNDIGRVLLRTAAPLCYDSYKNNRVTGSFVLVDQFTNETVAAGMIR